MKNEAKIRKLLGKRFHLSVSYDGKNLEITEWKLFKKYENGDPVYYSNDNKAIMTSDTHTEEELYKFAKSHQKYDLYKVNRTTRTVLLSIVLIMAILNIFIISKTISTIVLTTDFILMLLMFIEMIVDDKNFKVDMLEFRENFRKEINIVGGYNECNRKDNANSRIAK